MKRDNIFFDKKKYEYGQFFTVTNPFLTDVFLKWVNGIEKSEIRFNDSTITDPFAGNCDLIKHVEETGFSPKWNCYDIDPINDQIYEQNTFSEFPEGYKIAITNPPYLAKNSAKRKNLKYQVDANGYTDLYLYALHQMLLNCEYVAAILPQSFITTGKFRDRLMAIDLCESKLFHDTDISVCVAYFVKSRSPNFELYSDGNYLYEKSQLDNYMHSISQFNGHKWKHNDPIGEVGLHAIDGSGDERIRFVHGEEIKAIKIDSACRAYSRISGIPHNVNLDELIKVSNEILDNYRGKTADVLLTPFKGMRSDGKYRRRLAWDQSTLILNHAVHTLIYNKLGLLEW